MNVRILCLHISYERDENCHWLRIDRGNDLVEKLSGVLESCKRWLRRFIEDSFGRGLGGEDLFLLVASMRLFSVYSRWHF